MYKPLLNETAVADEIALIGFSVTLFETGEPSARKHGLTLSPTMDTAITLWRLDQLHLKRLFVKAETPVVLTREQGLLGIILGGDGSDCCRGQIGAGTGVTVAYSPHGAPTVVTIAETQRRDYRLDPMEPNLQISCQARICSIAIRLRQQSIDGLIEGQFVHAINFDKVGTDVQRAGQYPESSIVSGALKLTGIDLLNDKFSLRTIRIASGNNLLVGPTGNGHISIDVRPDSFVLNDNFDNAASLAIRPRTGEAYSVLPSALEVILREPWHKTLLGLFVACTPIIVQIIHYNTTGRRRRKSGARR